MILNHDIQFNDAPSDVKAAFSGGPPRKLLLASRTELYKFTQYGLFHNGHVSPWWSSVLPIDRNDTGLEELLERSGRLGTAAADFARARNAVTKQWNSMSGLLLAVLTSPVYAFVGRVRHQQYDNRPEFHNVVFIGGATQLWIPNLTAAQIRVL
jgi:hypothetical protein